MSNELLVGWKKISDFTRLDEDQIRVLAEQREFPISFGDAEGPTTTKTAVIEWVESRIKNNAMKSGG